MKVIFNNYSSIAFMKTYDIHTHKGHWWINATKDTPGAIKTKNGEYKVLHDLSTDIFELVNANLSDESNRVEKVFTSNLDCMVRKSPEINNTDLPKVSIPFLKNELEGNRELLKKSVNPNEYLYATGQPGFGNANNLKFIIEEAPDKFVGIKLHPKQIGISAQDPAYEPYLQLAKEKKLPVLFHSEVAIDWSKTGGEVLKEKSLWNNSDPRLIYQLAKKYPEVPVILGHTGAGGAPAHDIAINTLLESIKKKDANLYADISWMDFNNGMPAYKPEKIIKLIKELKKENALDRIMFGSDVPVGCFGEEQIAGKIKLKPSFFYDDMQSKIKQAIREDSELAKDAEEIIDKIFFKNAENLFFKPKTTKPKVKSKSLNFVFLSGVLAILTTGVTLIIKNNKKNQQNTK